MRKSVINLVFLGLFLLVAKLNAQDFKIIVNEANIVSSLSEQEITKIFLKKAIKWNDGKMIFPIDLESDNAVRNKFSKVIHQRGVGAIQAYWQRQIFSGRSIPPPEKSNDEAVLAYVTLKLGAIGYVSSNFPVTGVKILKIVKK